MCGEKQFGMLFSVLKDLCEKEDCWIIQFYSEGPCFNLFFVSKTSLQMSENQLTVCSHY